MTAQGLPWIKLYTDARHDPKIRKMPLEQQAVFYNLLQYAGEREARGEFSDADMELLALEVADDNMAVLTAALEHLLHYHVLQREEDGMLTFTAWPRLQARKPSDESDAVRERVTRYRARRHQPAPPEADVTPVTRYIENETPVTRYIENETLVTPKSRAEQSRQEQSRGDESRAEPEPLARSPLSLVKPEKAMYPDDDWAVKQAQAVLSIFPEVRGKASDEWRILESVKQCPGVDALEQANQTRIYGDARGEQGDPIRNWAALYERNMRDSQGHVDRKGNRPYESAPRIPTERITGPKDLEIRRDFREHMAKIHAAEAAGEGHHAVG
jgi:hypothetical protein